MSCDSVSPINFQIFIKIEDHVEGSLLYMCFALELGKNGCFSLAKFRADLSMGQIWSAACFCTAEGLIMVLHILIMGKYQNKNIYDILKLYEIQISVSKKEVLLELSHICSFIYC